MILAIPGLTYAHHQAWSSSDDCKMALIEEANLPLRYLFSDNVTFWLGPDHSTLDLVADSFPSDNGFILQPEPIDINVFVLADLKVSERKPRPNPAGNSPILSLIACPGKSEE